ncbi:hypothetical protein EDB80DRAFT_718625 [Ilyonectria destructans]|nr:hypothetical protein EDB80DRAFT_718625 [Ilyonectria destructans]
MDATIANTICNAMDALELNHKPLTPSDIYHLQSKGVIRDLTVHQGNSTSIEKMAMDIVQSTKPALRSRGRNSGKLCMIESTIKRYRALVKDKSKLSGPRDKSQPQLGLLAALDARYKVSPDIKHLDDWIEYLPEAFKTTRGRVWRAAIRKHWSRCYEERALLTMRADEVDESIAQNEMCIELCDPGRPRGLAHQNHARLLDWRYGLNNRIGDLAASGDALKRAADDIGERDDLTSWVVLLDNRTIKLGRLWETSRSQQSLVDAIALNELVVKKSARLNVHGLMPKVHLHGGMVRKNWMYARREPGFIEKAIDLFQGVLDYSDKIKAQHDAQHHALHNAQHNAQHKVQHKAETAVPPGTHGHYCETESATRKELACSYMHKFLFSSGAKADADKAIEHATQRQRRSYKNDAALFLAIRYSHFGKIKDLQDATLCAIKSLRRTKPQNEDFGRFLWFIANLLLEGYWGRQRTPSYWLLVRQRRVRRARIKSATVGATARYRYQSAPRRQVRRLAKKISWQSKRCATTALFLCKTVSALPTANLVKIFAAVTAGRIYSSAGAWEKSAAQFSQAFVYLRYLDVQYLDWSDRQCFIDLVNVGSSTAACAMLGAGHDPIQALRVLDTGRDIIVKSILGTKPNAYTTKLEKHDLELYREYTTVQTQTVAKPVAGKLLKDGSDQPPPAPELDELLDRRSALYERIRAIPGFETFHRQLSEADLLAAAEEGPIVCFALSRAGGYFLVITKDGLRSGKIAGLTEDMMKRDVWQLNKRKGTDRASTREREPRLQLMLRALGECLVHSFNEEYWRERDGRNELPRVWWHMSGATDLLPLHAAGPLPFTCDINPTGGAVVANDAPKMKRVISLAVSSYLPSIEHLIAARRNRRQNELPPKEFRRVLLVLMPWTAGYPDLDVLGHADAISAIMEEANWPPPIVLITPSREEVVDMLPHVHFVIFACHAVADPIDPSRHCLLLCPDPQSTPQKLTVKDIQDLELNDSRLACIFGSESASIGAGLQVAGFQEVVATLYPVKDALANRVCALFFQKIVEAEDVASYSGLFRSVVSKMRNETGLSGWSSFIHLGI